MVLCENFPFKICFLVFYLAQNCLSPQTPVQKKCTEEIKNVFNVSAPIVNPNRVYNKSAKEPKNLTRKHYAIAAYLNLRVPKESNLFAETTFFDKVNKKMCKDAQAYYEHILLPGHLLEGPFVKLPKTFCTEKHERYLKENPGGTNAVLTACMGQLVHYNIALEGNGLTVLKSIYENVVIDEIESKDAYAKDFIYANEIGLQAVPPMLLPRQFCKRRYPRVLEFADATFKPYIPPKP